MVLTIRSVHLTNTTSTRIASVPMAKSYLWPMESLQIVVSAIGEGDTEYYGRVEAIYELQFYGANPPNVSSNVIGSVQRRLERLMNI